MTKIKILYSNIKLENVPKNQKIMISNDLKSIYYYEQRKKIELKKIENLPKIEHYPFLDIRIINDSPINNPSLFKIYLEFNMKEFNEIYKKKCMLQDRRNFFQIINKCYWEYIYNYQSHNTLNFFEDLIEENVDYDTKINKNLVALNEYKQNYLEWMVYRENKHNEDYYFYQDSVLKLGDKFIDIKNGILLSELKKEKINIKGGIIVDDQSYHYMDNLVNLSYLSEKKTLCVDDKYLSNATLIICDKYTTYIWRDKINKIYNNLRVSPKVTLITNKREHSKYNYKDIIKSDFVIVSIEYISSKNYSNCWKDYYLNKELDLNQIFKIISDDYKGQNEVLKYKNPILSLIHWNRLIINESSFRLVLLKKNINEIVNTIKSQFRWVQIKELPLIQQDFTTLIKILSNSNTINYPLYNKNGTIKYLRKILKKIDTTMLLNKNVPILNKNTIKINMFNFQRGIYQFYKRLSNKSSNEIIYSIDNISLNSCSRKNLEKKIGKFEDVDECQICLDKITDKTITSCKHSYCTECILKNIHYSDRCPLCRHSICIEKIYRLVDKNTNKSPKLNSLSKLMKNVKEKTIVYIKNNELLCSLDFIDKDYCTVIKQKVRISDKEIKINNFNNSNDIKLVIMDIKDHLLSQQIKGVKKVIFADIIDGMENFSSNEYLGYDFINYKVDRVEMDIICYRATDQVGYIKRYLK